MKRSLLLASLLLASCTTLSEVQEACSNEIMTKYGLTEGKVDCMIDDGDKDLCDHQPSGRIFICTYSQSRETAVVIEKKGP